MASHQQQQMQQQVGPATTCLMKQVQQQKLLSGVQKSATSCTMSKSSARGVLEFEALLMLQHPTETYKHLALLLQEWSPQGWQAH